MNTQTLKTLGCSEEEIVVFVALLKHTPSTVLDIAKNTGIKRTTLYGLINKLLTRGIVIELIKKDTKTYEAVSQNKLEIIYDKKITELKDAKTGIKNLFDSIISIPTLSPRLETYYGKDGVKHILEDMLLKRNTETEALWPIKTMLEVLGADFFKYLNKERIKRNIYTRALWPHKQIVDTKKHPYLGSGENFLREIRVLPKDINFDMGYWIYDDRVAFISSEKEMYGFIVQSKELTQMLRVQFNILWKLGRNLKNKDTEEIQLFLNEIH